MRIREVIQALALSACCSGDDWDPETVVLPYMPEPTLADLIAKCEADDCEPLCSSSWLSQQIGGVPARNCYIIAGPQGKTLHLEQETECVGGRRPAGYRQARCGNYYAEQAQLEAASVRAFLDLDADLALHGAPRPLRHAARVAATDEVRHAAACARLAAASGVVARAPRVAAARRRSLRELAIDNAVEGIVRETYGAVVAAAHARAARSPIVRRTLRSIARDEAAHAELAFAIDRWLRDKLDRSARHAVTAAAFDAHAQLPQDATTRALLDYGTTPIMMS